MSLRIDALVAGDEIIGYQKIGLAIEKVRTGKGVVYREVPPVRRRASPSGLPKWRGWVVSNNTATHILTVNTAPLDLKDQSMWTAGETYLADIHYSSIKRMYLLSPFSIPGKELDPRRPTKNDSFGGASFKPYRVKEEVLIPIW
jgi:hypothetical protein